MVINPMSQVPLTEFSVEVRSTVERDRDTNWYLTWTCTFNSIKEVEEHLDKVVDCDRCHKRVECLTNKFCLQVYVSALHCGRRRPMKAFHSKNGFNIQFND